MKKSYKGFPLYLLIIMVVFAVAQMFTSSMSGQTGARIEYSEMLSHIRSGAIEQVAVQEDTIYARMASSSIPKEQFSSEAYDFVAMGNADTFVDTCRQLAAAREGKPIGEVTELDLGFELT